MTPELAAARERWHETMKAHRAASEAVLAAAGAETRAKAEEDVRGSVQTDPWAFIPEPDENEFVAFVASQIIADAEAAESEV